MRAIRFAFDQRRAGIRGRADIHVKRHLSEERYAKLRSFVSRSAVAENVRPRAAMRTLEKAHVLDDAQDRNVDSREHGKAAPGIDQRKVLWRRDDDGALQWNLLRQRELGVAGTGRHVHDHHVELTP